MVVQPNAGQPAHHPVEDSARQDLVPGVVPHALPAADHVRAGGQRVQGAQALDLVVDRDDDRNHDCGPWTDDDPASTGAPAGRRDAGRQYRRPDSSTSDENQTRRSTKTVSTTKARAWPVSSSSRGP